MHLQKQKTTKSRWVIKITTHDDDYDVDEGEGDVKADK